MRRRLRHATAALLPILAPFLTLLAPLLVVLAFVGQARADDDDDLKELLKLQQQQSAPPSAADNESMAKQIVQDMATLRHLPLKHPVAMQTSTREQIVGYVDSRIEEEMKGEDFAGQELALKRLGLVPEKMDMHKFLLDLYGEQVAGYYDPFKQKFFIASWMAPSMQAPIMAHELTHALQDQSFNLKPFLTPIPDNSDATSARQAVVEGDAVVSMFAWIGKQSGIDMTGPGSPPLGDVIRQSMAAGSAYPIFAGAPPYFQESLAFPYSDGTDFVQKTKEKGGWAAVDNLYANHPVSTAQILHPAKYPAGVPKVVDLAAKLPGWKMVNTDVLGELVIRTLLREYLEKDRADRVASAWSGDRYRAFLPDAGPKGLRGTMVVLRSIWETPAAARAFAEAYRDLVPRKYDGAKAREDASGVTFTTVEDGLTRIEAKGSEVLVADGVPDADTLAKVLAAGWKK